MMTHHWLQWKREQDCFEKNSSDQIDITLTGEAGALVTKDNYAKATLYIHS
jgi:hypothetical protein